MIVVADLQLHSRFSRAVSHQMTIPFIAQWARKKGIGLIATGDWTHPLWIREIQTNLEELGNGLLKLRTDHQSLATNHDLPLFLLATEISSIYSQAGKLRRVHTLVWVPTIASALKIIEAMRRRGCNLGSDGRPIVGLSCIHLSELVLSVEPKALLIPAHCLLPESAVLTDGFFPKPIRNIKKGERVFTHTGLFQKVTAVKKRSYTGDIITGNPWYFRPGLSTTPEHPYWAIKTLKKCPSTGDICRPSKAHLRLCRAKACLSYKPAWVMAKDLEIGDVLVYPRPKKKTVCKTIYLNRNVTLPLRKGFLQAGGTRGRDVRNALPVTPELGRLLGYYVAEGTTDGKNSFSFTFSNDEKAYIDDLLALIKAVLNLDKPRVHRRAGTKGVEIGFSSKIWASWLASICYQNPLRRKATTKKVPDFLFQADTRVRAEFLRGWYRGDAGYTSSRILMNHIKTLCLQIGIIPSIIVDTVVNHTKRGKHRFGHRIIHARADSFAFSTFAFFDDPYDLKKEIPRSQTKIDRRHGWIDKDHVYLPLKDISRKQYRGEVYNLEVANDHSYVTEFAAVHNCWTPWFSVYGSLGGFDSLDEAFGSFAKNIYAIETGLSSNPSMNWRITELDNRSIVSFSDAHSGPKLGREATVFTLKELSYEEMRKAIIGLRTTDYRLQQEGSLAVDRSQSTVSRISYTIEFYPEEGKYHYTGHRNCGISWGPEETKTKGTTCPVCHKPLTQGVMQRVEELAGRSEDSLRLEYGGGPPAGEAGSKEYGILKEIRVIRSNAFPHRPPFIMLVPLQEIIAEAVESTPTSQKVQSLYDTLTTDLSGEFSVLLQQPISAISHLAGEKVADGIDRVRRGDITIDPGYDGVFGKVKIWNEETEEQGETAKEQLSLF